MSVDWKLKTVAFLHDPPDKAISIAGHKVRRDSFLLTPLGITYDSYSTVVDMADHVSAAMQRMNIPQEIEDIVIDFTRTDRDYWPKFIHPLSSTQKEIDIRRSIESSFVGEKRPEQKFLIDKYDLGISNLKDKDPKKEFFKVWRLLPVKYPIYWDIPADTRIPDHTIWDHIDATSALVSCMQDGIAFLSFKIGPVQEFIENASKVSDLWAGSHLLSFLSFSGIRVIAEELGPDAVIFPYLRGQPFVDLWLSTQGILATPAREQLRVSNIPHRFLAIVPKTKAKELSTRVEESVRHTWTKIGNTALKRLHEKAIEIDDELSKIWDRQIGDAFHITTQILDWANPPENADGVRRLFGEIDEKLPNDLTGKYEKWLAHYKHKMKKQSTGFEPNAGSLYGLYYELIGALIDQKSRFFEHLEEPGEVGGEKGGRCSLCGVRNPIRREDSKVKEFWTRMREQFPGRFDSGDKLCAVCTVKRFYRELNPLNVNFPVRSAATVASTDFMRDCRKNEAVKKALDDFLSCWNSQFAPIVREESMNPDNLEGEWLYEESYSPQYLNNNYGVEVVETDLCAIKEKLSSLLDTAKKNSISPPRKYYSILVMDVDRMGWKLRGKGQPHLKEFLHHEVKHRMELSGEFTDLLNSDRILNPDVHLAISRALLEFSVNILGNIIEKHEGLLVYSGGDDVLALLPAREALDTAKEINETIAKDFDKVRDRNVMLLGKGSTMSAGIVFAHYKYPLFDALERAREARESAKREYGRNAFVLVDIRHSGQISISGGKWEIVENLNEFVKLMMKEKEEGGLSPRFIYHLLQDTDALERLDDEKKLASLRYLLDRHLGERVEKRNERLKSLSKGFLDAADKLSKLPSVKNPMEEIAKNIRILYTVGKEGEE